MSWAELQAVQQAYDSGRPTVEFPVGLADLPVPHLDHLDRLRASVRDRGRNGLRLA
jgi:hypothetical protein